MHSLSRTLNPGLEWRERTWGGGGERERELRGLGGTGKMKLNEPGRPRLERQNSLHWAEHAKLCF